MTSAGRTKEIEIEVGLHQGSALSPLLFVIIIDVITEEIDEGTPWAMLFADDLVLCDPDRQMMEVRLERWRECMEKNGLSFLISVSASYCIPQCVRLIAGVCTHYVVYNISKKKNTVDKSKIKDKRKVKPKDKSWVKIGWMTKNRKGWCVQKR